MYISFLFFYLFSLVKGLNVEIHEDRSAYIDDLVNRAVDGDYPGDDRVKVNGKPKYTQRTSILYYYRRHIDKPLLWATIAMGVDNSYSMFSDKKRSLSKWKKLNPVGYERIQHYIPQFWGKYDDLKEKIDSESIYVYKPSDGYAGKGITFESGDSILKKTRELDRLEYSSWVVQEFIMPKLYNKRKTHFRVLSLFVVQPSGKIQAYIYKNMRMFSAKDEFSLERLHDPSDDKTLMLMTNINVTYQKFISDPNNEGEYFDWRRYMMDVESALGKEEYMVIHSKMMELHEAIYSTIGNHLKCHKTEVSIYSKSCYHIIASDVAMNDKNEARLLETNISMAMKRIWSNKEINEFTGEAAYLMDLPESPYDHRTESDVWSRVFNSDDKENDKENDKETFSKSESDRHILYILLLLTIILLIVVCCIFRCFMCL